MDSLEQEVLGPTAAGVTRFEQKPATIFSRWRVVVVAHCLEQSALEMLRVSLVPGGQSAQPTMGGAAAMWWGDGRKGAVVAPTDPFCRPEAGSTRI